MGIKRTVLKERSILRFKIMNVCVKVGTIKKHEKDELSLLRFL